MNRWEGGLLGLVQGLTEFLPVSSTGHLVLVQELLGTRLQGALVEALLHLGTVLAVLVNERGLLPGLVRQAVRLETWVSRRPPADPAESDLRSLLRFTAISSAVTAVLYLPFRPWFDLWLEATRVTAYGLLITGFVLQSARWFYRFPEQPIGGWTAVIMGVAQTIAIVPGISRSGLTLVTGLALGIPRTHLVRYSFLMSVPVIAGGVLLELLRTPLSPGLFSALSVGMILSLVSGWLAIRWISAWVRNCRIHWFTPYVWAAGLAALWYFP